MAVAAAIVYATSVGDAFVAAALLGVAAGPWAGGAAAAAAGAAVARWGTADLADIAGNQDVLGPGIATGPVLAGAATALAAAGVLATAAHARRDADDRERLTVAAAAGAGAAALAFGPAPTSPVDAAARVTALVAGIAAARFLPLGRLPVWAPVAAAGAGLVLAVAA